MERITIVGLGLIGTSIGLGLKKANLKDIEIVGTDKDSEVSSRASKLGAIDKASRGLIPAIQDTDLVILATPVMAMKELMEVIGLHLREGATVTDTGSTKSSVMAWAEEYLPDGVSFVGGHPMAGKEKSGPDVAEATLFNKAPYCIIPGKKANPTSVKSVAGLAEILGAKPMFMDAQEHDSFVAAISHLPMILSIALVTSTAKSPQWSEMARLASTGYRDITRLASGDPQMNRDICLTNADFLVRWVDEIIKELYEFRNNIKDGRESLLSTFVQAWEARARWLAGVTREEAKVELPTVGDSFATMLGGERLARKLKEITSRDKKDPTKYYKK